MRSINLNLSFEFPAPSSELPKHIAKALEPLEGTLLENKTLRFFKPKNFRDPATLVKEVVAKEAAKLGAWLDDGFNSMLSPGYAAMLAKQVMTGIPWVLPDYDVTDPIMTCVTRLTAVNLLVDDLCDMDGKNFQEEFRPSKAKIDQIKTTSLALMKMAVEFDLFMTESLDDELDPLIKTYFVLVLKNFGNLGFANTEDIAKVAYNLMRAMISTGSANDWLCRHANVDIKSKYSIDFVRHFRSADTEGPALIHVLHDPRFGPLSDAIMSSEQVKAYLNLSYDISAGLNDTLGFRKDIVKGESGGMIMLRISWGEDPIRVFDDEWRILQKNIDNYLLLREELLNNFQEMENFVNTMDTYIHGYVQALNNSSRYLMNGGISVDDQDN